MPSIQANFDNMFRFGGAAIILVGIFMVLQPFVSALVFAGVLAIATWPLFERLRKAVGGNSTLAATTMLLAILVLVIIPITLLSSGRGRTGPRRSSELAKGWTQDGRPRARVAEVDSGHRRAPVRPARIAAGSTARSCRR